MIVKWTTLDDLNTNIEMLGECLLYYGLKEMSRWCLHVVWAEAMIKEPNK